MKKWMKIHQYLMKCINSFNWEKEHQVYLWFYVVFDTCLNSFIFNLCLYRHKESNSHQLCTLFDTNMDQVEFNFYLLILDLFVSNTIHKFYVYVTVYNSVNHILYVDSSTNLKRIDLCYFRHICEWVNKCSDLVLKNFT